MESVNVLPPCTDKLEQFLHTHTISDFHIENTHFLVITFGNSSSTCSQENSDFSIADFPLPILCCFEVNQQLCAIVKTQSYQPDEDIAPTQVLTGRELQITRYVALGWSNKQIAHQLRISEWTVSTHIRRIFIKLDVDSRAAMVYRCASLIRQL